MHEDAPVEVYYDAECPLCTAAAKALSGGGHSTGLRFLPTQAAPPGSPDPQELLRRIHVHADGRWLNGARALERALRETPRHQGLRLLLRLGIALRVADPIYDLLARNRQHLGLFRHVLGRPPGPPQDRG